MTLTVADRENLLVLRRERSESTGEMRSLLDRARREGRDLTADEAARYDRLEADVRRMHGESEAIRARIDADDLGAGIRSADLRRLEDMPRDMVEWMGGELRALVEGSGSGAVLVPEEWSSDVWGALTARSVGLQSGFTGMATDSDTFHLPVLTADAAAGWYSEAAEFTDDSPAFSDVVARPRKLGAFTKVSNELLADATPAAVNSIFASLARSLALKLDAGFFIGTGTAPEIKGLKSLTGSSIVSMGTNGAELTSLDPFANAIGLLEGDNAQATAIVMHPRDWTTLLKLKEESGSLKPVMQDSAGSPTDGVRRSIYGVPVYLTSQLPTDEDQGTATDQCSSLYVYDAAQIIVVRRATIRLDVSTDRYFETDQTAIRATLRCDLVVPHEETVVRVQGVKPTP